MVKRAEEVKSKEPVRSRVIIKRFGRERGIPAEEVAILDFEEENEEGIEPGSYALVPELSLSQWDEDFEARKRATNQIAEKLRIIEGYKGKKIALEPKYLFLPEIDRGPWLALRIEETKE